MRILRHVLIFIVFIVLMTILDGNKEILLNINNVSIDKTTDAKVEAEIFCL